MDPIITVTETSSLLGPVMTFHHDDRRFDGLWSRPNVSALVFSDSRFANSLGVVVPAFPFGYNGGPIGARGMPVQLIFWGDWWQTTAGAERAGWVESSTRALLASHYVDELRQYSIDPTPVFRGSTFVISPDPPGHVHVAKADEAVGDLIDGLIEQDEFPDPDDGPRIAFIVCMPPTFDADVDSWHNNDREYDPPFDVDEVWFGLIRHYNETAENVDNMMREMSEMIVSIATDPERDGWRVDPTGNSTIVEITDVAVSTINGRLVAQAGYVNGVKASPYWSNRHNATVLPIDTDYAARLAGIVEEDDRKAISQGTFRPDPSDSSACSTELPECCIDDRDYAWAVFGVAETALVELHTERFHTPVASWTINGRPVTSSGFITLDVILDKFDERETVSVPGSITLDYVAQPTSLKLHCRNADGNFDVAVGCTVIDAAITGNLTTNVVATPTVGVGFVGAVLEIEEDYVDQRTDCYQAMLRKFNHLKIPVGPQDHEGVDYEPGIDVLVIPSYARHSGAAQLRLAKNLVRAANALLEPETARQFIDNLLASTPILAGAVFRQKIFRPR